MRYDDVERTLETLLVELDHIEVGLEKEGDVDEHGFQRWVGTERPRYRKGFSTLVEGDLACDVRSDAAMVYLDGTPVTTLVDIEPDLDIADALNFSYSVDEFPGLGFRPIAVVREKSDVVEPPVKELAVEGPVDEDLITYLVEPVKESSLVEVIRNIAVVDYDLLSKRVGFTKESAKWYMKNKVDPQLLRSSVSTGTGRRVAFLVPPENQHLVHQRMQLKEGDVVDHEVIREERIEEYAPGVETNPQYSFVLDGVTYFARNYIDCLVNKLEPGRKRRPRRTDLSIEYTVEPLEEGSLVEVIKNVGWLDTIVLQKKLQYEGDATGRTILNACKELGGLIHFYAPSSLLVLGNRLVALARPGTEKVIHGKLTLDDSEFFDFEVVSTANVLAYVAQTLQGNEHIKPMENKMIPMKDGYYPRFYIDLLVSHVVNKRSKQIFAEYSVESHDEKYVSVIPDVANVTLSVLMEKVGLSSRPNSQTKLKESEGRNGLLHYKNSWYKTALVPKGAESLVHKKLRLEDDDFENLEVIAAKDVHKYASRKLTLNQRCMIAIDDGYYTKEYIDRLIVNENEKRICYRIQCDGLVSVIKDVAVVGKQMLQDNYGFSEIKANVATVKARSKGLIWFGMPQTEKPDQFLIPRGGEFHGDLRLPADAYSDKEVIGKRQLRAYATSLGKELPRRYGLEVVVHKNERFYFKDAVDTLLQAA